MKNKTNQDQPPETADTLPDVFHASIKQKPTDATAAAAMMIQVDDL